MNSRGRPYSRRSGRRRGRDPGACGHDAALAAAGGLSAPPCAGRERTPRFALATLIVINSFALNTGAHPSPFAPALSPAPHPGVN